MRTLEQVLEHIENKKCIVLKENKRIYGERLESIRGLYPVIGYNVGFDPYWLTEDLTDEEFKTWYNYKQKTWWEEIGEEVKCLKCNELINEPEQVIRWAGVIYHGTCFIKMVEVGEFPISYDAQPYYERIKKAVFKS